MSKRKIKSRRHGKSTAPAHRHGGETRSGDAATIAWTVSVTMVLVCDIVAIAAHFYTENYPFARGINLLKELMLAGGAVIGFISLALLPIVLKVRRAPPPTGIMAFGLCAAAGPILALIVRNLR